MADVTLAMSFGVRAEEPACTISNVCWSMVGCGPGTDFLFKALLAFLLWANYLPLPGGGVWRPRWRRTFSEEEGEEGKQL